MSENLSITVDGRTFAASYGDLLLDAALKNGVDLPYDCRAGHCGTCCVRLVAGEVHGGEVSEPGIVHPCQSLIATDIVVESRRASPVRSVAGVLTAVRALSADVVQVGIRTERALPHHPGQYCQLQFDGYPARPFSITQPLLGTSSSGSTWFHIRRMEGGRVTPALGNRIRRGHRVSLTGPYGVAHFRPALDGRLILVATNTGFAPIWSIAIAALREDPARQMIVIAGGRTLDALYMGPALASLKQFPNVVVVPACSTPQPRSSGVLFGRPTDFLPRLLPSDVFYACGAPPMVDAMKAVAASVGAVCYADPFMTSSDPTASKSSLARALEWLAAPARPSSARAARSPRRNLNGQRRPRANETAGSPSDRLRA